MKILAIDTATEACSAALYIEGEITHQYQLAPREHTRLILTMVETLLDQSAIKIADLDALAFGRGPGSFTGVRIATGVVQGFAFAADLPVLPVSTLASLAQQVYDQHQQTSVLAGIDARMGEIYWGCYQLANYNSGPNSGQGLMQLVGQEQVSAVENIQLADKTEHWCGAGSAWDSYSEQLNKHLGQQIKQSYADYFPHSASIVRLAADAFQRGEAVEASQALPVYLRNDVAKKKKTQMDVNNRK